MEVLMIARRGSPELGGVEKHIKNLTKELSKEGVKTILVTARDIKYPKIPILGLIYIWLWFLFNLSYILRANVIHVHDVFIWYLPFRFLLFAKPVYTTFHGWEGKFPIPQRYFWIRKLSAYLSWGTISVGQYIEKWYSLKSDFIIWGAVKKTRKIAKPKGNLIIYLGRLSQDTGLNEYLRGWEIVKKNFPKLRIEFLGDGPLREKAGQYGKVHGFVENVERYIQKSRFIFTAGYLSMLEAMARKRLVFAVYNSSLKRDILRLSPFGKHAVIFSRSKTLVKKLSYYLYSPSKERGKVEKAYNWASKNTWKSVAQVYLKLWQKKK